MRRNDLLLRTAILALGALWLFAVFKRYNIKSVKSINQDWSATTDEDSTGSGASQSNALPAASSTALLPLKNGNDTLLQLAPAYINAIMTPEDRSFPRLECAKTNGSFFDRYSYLKDDSRTIDEPNTLPKYFFALDLHQCAHKLPRLLGSVVESIRILGPENCALSIVEGRSDDGTFEISKLLRKEIENLGARYFFDTSEIDPLAGDRIKALAELRNQALSPFVDHPDHFSADTTIVFLNDVSLCTEDILELIHQRLYQNADMTCAMDWTYVGPDPTFYDVWITRGMTGDLFFNVPEDGNWDSAWNLLWNDSKAKERMNAGLPFQVFSCWNGAAAFTSKPLRDQKIRFRSSYNQECHLGEPTLYCKDMWQLGYGKIAVVPSVNLEYSDEAAKKIKELKGYVSRWASTDATGAKIEWETAPPPLIKCIGSWANQTWRPWNEQLEEQIKTSNLRGSSENTLGPGG